MSSTAHPADAAGALPLPPDAQATRGRLPLRVKTLFSIGDIVDGTVTYGVAIFLFYYLTAVCGMSGATAGTILVLSTVIDGVADPFVGSISDNTNARLGRRLPYMFASGLPTALAFGLIFSIPAFPPGWMLALYAGVVLLALRLATSFFFLPYASLSAELSDDYTERSFVFAYRTFFNCVGNIILLVLGYWVFMRGHEGLLDRGAYAAFGWTIAAVALAASLISAFGALPQLPQLRRLNVPTQFGLRQLVRELTEVFQARSFLSLFLSTLLFWTSAGLAATLGVHANLYFWKLPDEVVATLPLVNIAGFVAGLPLSAYLTHRFEKREVALIGLFATCGVQFVAAPLAILGVLPTGTALHIILGAIAFAGGMAGTCAFVAWGSMMSDAVDEHELLFGSRREGVYFAGLTVSIKAATGIGGLLAGLSLDIIGFPSDLANADLAAIAPATLDAIGIVQGPVAGLLGIGGVILLRRYRIDRKELARIQAELAARAEAAAAGGVRA
ncbi:MAG: MFS transporter [Alphaproteobacteria bacterium]|nr:MFS transporter [Alphaproteobacteria bacterium]